MPIKIIKAFLWSPNGYDVATVEAGEYESLPVRAGEIAAQVGALHLPTDGQIPVAVETAPAALPVGAVAVEMVPDASAMPTVAPPQVEVMPQVSTQDSGETKGVATSPHSEPTRRRNRRASGEGNG
ncbi:hypothetical protein N8H69_05315 [Achromobacter spanius]|uniref:hypothetical protein n=1 Tax=Achromobacter spanius TaxID=217203 RepID=UPI0022275352|nr:hypothetical protein [Achromobacter spanius]MCW3151944.1 hypothetical protein [Achromobacter spanius]